ncbi:MAG: bifunctional riboflavin kinase/FAD synthetase [Bacteroidetes bacterium]|nr:bifunctional riboflavin kinase/FAD synthetase [Bacteroidota bacterium]
MKVYESIEQFKGAKNPAVTIGTFDGVHLGHQKIIQQLKEGAETIKGESVILTFYPHPRMVLFPDDEDLKLLNTEEEKKDLLEKLGVEHLIVHPFTKKFSRFTYTEYVRDILVNKIKTKKLIIGYNHHFGRNREGSFQQLKKLATVYGFELEKIAAQDINKIEISSTKIRKALESGDIKTANKFLGYEYSIKGKVVKGKGIGKGLGYPTANIQIDDKHKLIPANGVYAVTVQVENKMHNGMMSIGFNPTVNPTGNDSNRINGHKKSIEVNIFDFEKDIYGENIRIFFRQKLRDEKKFENMEALKKAIDGDKEKTLKILSPSPSLPQGERV